MIRDVSDTAMWVAMYRAWESERADAVFRDPYARRLAGERGAQIADSIDRFASWSFVARTHLIDELIREQVAQGTDMVINLAAGLCARPYRMDLPPALTWVEVDLPPMLEYKEEALAGERPVCTLERVPLDLAQGEPRRQLLQELGGRARRAMVITEGLLIYLDPSDVCALAADLAAQASMRAWATDLSSPGLVARLRKPLGQRLEEAGAPFRFAPAEGAEFFRPFGWTGTRSVSLLKTARRLNRLNWLFRLLALLPDPKAPYGPRTIWGGVCLLERQA